MDCRSPITWWARFIGDELWPIQPDITVSLLERVDMSVQPHVCPVNFSPHIKNDLGSMFDTFPRVNWFTSLLEMERNLEDLVFLSASLQKCQELAGLTLKNECIPRSRFRSRIEY